MSTKLKDRLRSAIDEGMTYAPRTAIPNLYDTAGHKFWMDCAADSLLKLFQEEYQKLAEEVIGKNDKTSFGSTDATNTGIRHAKNLLRSRQRQRLQEQIKAMKEEV